MHKSTKPSGQCTEASRNANLTRRHQKQGYSTEVLLPITSWATVGNHTRNRTLKNWRKCREELNIDLQIQGFELAYRCGKLKKCGSTTLQLRRRRLQGAEET